MHPEYTPEQIARFWARVDKTGECWVWTGCRLPRGYGTLTLGGRTSSAHRLSYILAHGPIPAGLHVCHRCDNPPCVNPAHLYLGTNAQNMRDAVRNGLMASGERHGLAKYPERRPRGAGHGMAKLTEADVLAIRQRHQGGETQMALATAYRVSFQTIHLIVRRKRWAHLA